MPQLHTGYQHQGKNHCGTVREQQAATQRSNAYGVILVPQENQKLQRYWHEALTSEQYVRSFRRW